MTHLIVSHVRLGSANLIVVLVGHANTTPLTLALYKKSLNSSMPDEDTRLSKPAAKSLLCLRLLWAIVTAKYCRG